MVDQKALSALATKLYVVLGTLITTLLSMAEEEVAAAGHGSGSF